MAKRLSTHRLCHQFAGTDDAAKSYGALHTSLDGRTLVSYAEPIARKFDNKHAWVTSQKFSVTTSKHTSWAAGALRMAGYTVHYSETPEICVHCNETWEGHAGKKCLYEATTFEAA